MKKLSTILIPLLILTSPILSYADVSNDVVVDNETAEQESEPVIMEDEDKNSVTSTNQFFELEIVRGTQNPLNKNIPYTIYITPKIDSERTQIKWEVPSTLLAKPSHKEFVNLEKDQTYTYKANIDPQRAGTYDVTVNVIAWQYNVNYTNSVSSTVELSESLTVQPVDSAYMVTIVLIVAIGLILSGLVIFLIYKSSAKIMKKLRIWLTPPY
jgi:hypothetical protein